MAFTATEAIGIALGVILAVVMCTMVLCCFVRAPKNGFCCGFCCGGCKPEAPKVHFDENQRNTFLTKKTPCLFSKQNPVVALYNGWVSSLWVSVRGALQTLPPSKA